MNAYAMPVVLPNTVYMAALVRGAEKAAETLGEDHFAIIGSISFREHLQVFRKDASTTSLDRFQGHPKAPSPLWSAEFNSNLIKDAKLPLYAAVKMEYFFLTEAEAEEYVTSVVDRTCAFILEVLKSEEASS